MARHTAVHRGMHRMISAVRKQAGRCKFDNTRRSMETYVHQLVEFLLGVKYTPLLLPVNSREEYISDRFPRKTKTSVGATARSNSSDTHILFTYDSTDGCRGIYMAMQSMRHRPELHSLTSPVHENQASQQKAPATSKDSFHGGVS
jgi:hypothetical protein